MYSQSYLEILELGFEFVDHVGQLVDHLNLRCIAHIFLAINPIKKNKKYSKWQKQMVTSLHRLGGFNCNWVIIFL